MRTIATETALYLAWVSTLLIPRLSESQGTLPIPYGVDSPVMIKWGKHNRAPRIALLQNVYSLSTIVELLEAAHHLFQYFDQKQHTPWNKCQQLKS